MPGSTSEATARQESGAFVTFSVTWCSCPQTLMRILGMFTQQDIIPLSVEMTRSGEYSKISVRQDGLEERRALIILEKMRALPNVDSASLVEDDWPPLKGANSSRNETLPC